MPLTKGLEANSSLSNKVDLNKLGKPRSYKKNPKYKIRSLYHTEYTEYAYFTNSLNEHGSSKQSYLL